MQRITDPTAAASLPAPPALTGSVGYFTGGSPGVTAATRVRYWWLNMIQEELMALLALVGITPDTTGANNAQVAQAIGLLGPTGQCRLVYTSGTVVTLTPSNGNRLRINGLSQQVPSAGVTLANTGLSASTLYYVYASMSGGVMQLAASTTGYAVSSTDGTKVKSGDATQALVGMVYPGAGTPGVFTDTPAWRGVASYFDRHTRPIAQGANFSSQGTTSGTPVEITAGVRATFLAWADEAVIAQTTAVIGVSGTGNTASNQIAFDGTVSGTAGQMYSYTSGEGASATGSASALLTEGAHYATAFGATSGGATGTWLSGGLTGAVRI